MNTLSRLLARERFAITYRPEISRLLGDPLAAIVFQQALFHANQSDGAFPKFFEPCSHSDYISGDSWTEELAMTRDRFTSALEKISTKIKFSLSTPVQHNASTLHFDTEGIVSNAAELLYSWTDSTRRSWFLVNAVLAEELLQVAYMGAGDRKAYIERHRNPIEVSEAPIMVDILPVLPDMEEEPVIVPDKKRARKKDATVATAEPKRKEGEKELIEWWTDKNGMNRPCSGVDVKMFRIIITQATHYGWTTEQLLKNMKSIVVWMRADSFMSTQISTGFIVKKLPIWWDEIGSKEIKLQRKDDYEALPEMISFKPGVRK